VKANGSVYVAVVFAVLFGYFGYQWWFNPARAIKGRLGELAAVLSVVPGETDSARVMRLAKVGRYLAEDVRLGVGTPPVEFGPRGALLSGLASWAPPGGADVQFADLQVAIDSESEARVQTSVELTTRDPQTGQPTVDARDVNIRVTLQAGGWVVAGADSKSPLQR
jgi:hypothetical protein